MKLIKIPDVFIIVTAIFLVIFSSYSAYIKPQGKSRVLLRARGGEWIYQIDSEETIAIQGPLGNTVVRISGNRAWVESSPCGNQTCVALGEVFQKGQWAACLPNNVLLLIQSAPGEDTDAVSW